MRVNACWLKASSAAADAGLLVVVIATVILPCVW